MTYIAPTGVHYAISLRGLFRTVLALISFAPLTSPSAAIEFKLTLLSFGLDDSQVPVVNGDNVIWFGKQGTQWDVYRYHIPSGTRTILNDTMASPERLSIDGNYVLWEGFGIFLHDLASGSTLQISSEPRSLVPQVSGNDVIWLEGREQDSRKRIMHYSIDTMTSSQLVGYGERDDLRISGDDVVWDQRVAVAPTTEEVFHYSLQTGATTRLTTNAIADSYPEVSEGNVVWQSFDTELTAEVFHRNIQTGITQRLTTNAESDRTPEISGENVVWQGSTGGGAVSNIFHRNLATGVTTRLTNSTGHPESHGVPKVNGLSIVWNALLDFGGNNQEIFFYSLADNMISRVTDNAFREQDAEVFGHNIVFRRERPIFSNIWDVYLATPIPEPSALALICIAGVVVVCAARRSTSPYKTVRTSFRSTSISGSYRLCSRSRPNASTISSWFSANCTSTPCVASSSTTITPTDLIKGPTIG